MQWDSSRFAGFTAGTPWLRLAADHAAVNVATLAGQGDSMFSLYRALIGLRNSNAALHSGGMEQVASNGRVLRYERTGEEQRFSVLLNLSESTEESATDAGNIVVSTHMDRSGEVVGASLSLRPFEGVLVRLD